MRAVVLPVKPRSLVVERVRAALDGEEPRRLAEIVAWMVRTGDVPSVVRREGQTYVRLRFEGAERELAVPESLAELFKWAREEGVSGAELAGAIVRARLGSVRVRVVSGSLSPDGGSVVVRVEGEGGNPPGPELESVLAAVEAVLGGDGELTDRVAEKLRDWWPEEGVVAVSVEMVREGPEVSARIVTTEGGEEQEVHRF